MTDVFVQRRAERLDLILPDVDLARADSELEEAVGEVPDEEQDAVADEPDGCRRHEPDTEPSTTVVRDARVRLRTHRGHSGLPSGPSVRRTTEACLKKDCPPNRAWMRATHGDHRADRRLPSHHQLVLDPDGSLGSF